MVLHGHDPSTGAQRWADLKNSLPSQPSQKPKMARFSERFSLQGIIRKMPEEDTQGASMASAWATHSKQRKDSYKSILEGVGCSDSTRCSNVFQSKGIAVGVHLQKERQSTILEDMQTKSASACVVTKYTANTASPKQGKGRTCQSTVIEHHVQSRLSIQIHISCHTIKLISYRLLCNQQNILNC